ncbi:MAG: PAS domain S-box protein [Bryobacterales bacterium]|nr:PAS domain S-box protein [Bryobacterales bacterium]
MRYPWVGSATGTAAQPAPSIAQSAFGAGSFLRQLEGSQEVTILRLNRQLECVSYHGPTIPALQLGSSQSVRKPLLRLLSKAPSLHILLQAAQDGLRGRASSLELRMDSQFWELQIIPIFAEEEQVESIALSIRPADATAETLQALAESTRRYRLAAESGRVGVWEWQFAASQLLLDPVLLSILGYEEERNLSHEEISEKIFAPEDLDYLRRGISDLVQGRKENLDLDLRARCRMGDSRIMRLSATLVRDEKGEPEKAVGIAIDITALRDAEFRSKQSEARLRELFENATDMMYSTGIEGDFKSVNKAFLHTTGYGREELLHMNLRDLVFPSDRREIERILLSRLGGAEKTIDEVTLRHRDGRKIYVEVSNRLVFEGGKPSLIQGIARDVTERKLLEEQLRQSQKMEAVGTLAGGIAHDFNNLLTGILGFADLLKARPDDREKTLEAADIIQKAAERATKLTSQLIGFARQGKTQTARISIQDLVHELTEFLGHTLPRSIKIAEDLPEEPIQVLGDQNQLHQALLNLALNARDAMPNGGQLIFRAEKLNRTDMERIERVSGPGEEWLCLSVTDTGEGISDEILTRIFEPFFTTKTVGKGSGMGLAMVYSIVRNHNGHIDVESDVTRGSIFRIFLPMAEPEKVVREESDESGFTRGSGVVLLVDDEEIVLTVAKTMLTQLGYTVLTAENGARALEIYRANPGQIDLVFLDVMMPGIDGRECARRLRAEYPEVRILLTSGYLPETIETGTPRIDGLPLLNKPYQLTDLSQVIEQTLSAPARWRTGGTQ